MTDEIENKDMTSSDFVGATIKGSNFKDADLSQSTFLRAKFFHSRFEQADMRYTNLAGANLEGSILNYADLKGVAFNRSHVDGKKVLFIFMRGDHTCYLLEDGTIKGGCQEGTIGQQRRRISEFGYGIEKRKVMTAFLDAAEIILGAYNSSNEYKDGDYTSEYDGEE